MITRLSLALAASVLLASSAAAHSGNVTVHRGADTHTVAVDAQGNAAAPQTRIERVPVAEVAQDTVVDGDAALAVGGRTLWILDGAGNQIIACRLYKTFRVGDREIRCEADDLTQVLLEADALN